jgi:hypothetical protein
MSFSPEVRDPVEPTGHTVRIERRPTWAASGITAWFNVALFAYLAATGILDFLLVSGKAKDVPLSGLILTSSIDMGRYLAALLITSLLLKEFWRRFIAPLCNLRAITSGEAISVVLMIGILFRA